MKLNLKSDEIDKTFLKENERIDDLQYKDLKIIQNNTGFCFGIDSVILSDFVFDGGDGYVDAENNPIGRKGKNIITKFFFIYFKL